MIFKKILKITMVLPFLILMIFLSISCDSSGGNNNLGGDNGAGVNAPAAPVNITVTAADSQLTVSWSAVIGAAKYTLYYGTALSYETASKIENLTMPGKVITGLANNTTYNIWVQAHNSAGSSNVSAVLSGTPRAAETVPSAPQGVTAAAEETGKLKINWNAPDGAITYKIYYSTLDIIPSHTDKIGITGTTFTLTELADNTLYYIWVAAANSIGDSAASLTASGTTLPAAPLITSVVGGIRKLTVSWTTVSGAASYDLYYSTTATAPNSANITGITETSKEITNLENNTNYNIWVKAKAASNIYSSYSSMASGVTLIPGIKTVAAGGHHTIILREDGTLLVTGLNNYGQLGLGNTENKNKFTNITDITSIKNVSAGYYHTMIVKEDGTLLAAGYNSYGQLGLGDLEVGANKTAFTNVTDITSVKNVYAGGAYTMILKEDGTLLAAGYNNNGQLGLGNTENKSTFTKVTGITGTIKTVAAGGAHAIMHKEDETLWAAGWNSYGQLGLGDAEAGIDKSTFTQIPGITGAIKNIYAREQQSMIYKEDGTLLAAGYNNYGQLGLGNTENKNTFTQVTDITGTIKNVYLGGYHAMIAMENGKLLTAGRNRYGQLGLGNTENKNTFTQVTDITGTIKNVYLGALHSIIVMENGKLLAAGRNDAGQLGYGDNTDKNAFIEIDY